MQQAIPYKAWPLPLPGRHAGDQKPATQFHGSEKGAVRDAVSENAVIVLARRGCCMSHVVKRLLNGHGVNPSVFEFEEDEENDVAKELETIGAEHDGENNRRVQFPAVFIGGRMFGGLDQVMATHISGELIPALKKAGALWL
ncbi:putative glutaredoxin, Thioredoxin-like superfamily [Helianthus annuus]|uniref:Glutaredoxin-like, plant II, Thioredoxin-like superfamily n=2 Tax=Helianthus annuus TaxID=4232 RepID=A0A9K3DIM0_HELAN|nr:glutaredoxin-C9 [Helianthus annuus]KAF5756105.1 putative glutaredoxin-like, plant II, Thioredoxin-like superfamily [Helianthus annuus]KAJ0429666.1 putative glutaredoxin, Thioredoxin-like superfamily [Helianthus annuus]KAJ0434283.1 putative glutaredoxin, Thioredoxin-like superfamily [Helianthus annuus]KAJ0448102.1 putative glutaredoxin, Thioredoxin-like superfamily [Helianthus annuus]KAJ0632991.1 putative glutaredoxin, Thioredoxin-like superfamily [Helianthus annuus]